MGAPVLAPRAALVPLGGGVLVLFWPGALGPVCVVGALAGLAILGIDWVLAPRPSSIEVVRRFPAVLSLEASGELIWLVTNPHRRRATVAIADDLAPSLRASGRRVRLRLAPGQTRIARASVRPGRRGRFVSREMVVRTLGPLGLMGRQSALAFPAELKVYPSFGSRRQAELRMDRQRVLEIGLRSARMRGGATDFEQLRDYSVDDDARRIDWAATARADRPIVRSYRAERNQRVICLLDNGRAMAGQVGGVARAEHAMDAVMMLTAVAARLGDLPGLVAFDRQVRAVVPPRGGPSQLPRVTEALYQLQPVLAQSDYRGAFSQVLGHSPRRALLCLLTELDEALFNTLVPVLGLVARTHVLMVGAVPDPAVVAWARGGQGAAGAYRAAAAAGALARRRELAHILAARGVMVVDALPGALAPQLTDTYLQVKASGRL